MQIISLIVVTAIGALGLGYLWGYIDGQNDADSDWADAATSRDRLLIDDAAHVIEEIRNLPETTR